jgi:hypothetical protein
MRAIIGESADRTETMTVLPDVGLRDLISRGGAFDLATRAGGFEVTVHVKDRPEGEVCSDAHVGDRPASEPWRATKGTLTVAVPPSDGQRRVRTSYRATIRIEGAEFVNNAGVRVVQSQPIALTVAVRVR